MRGMRPWQRALLVLLLIAGLLLGGIAWFLYAPAAAHIGKDLASREASPFCAMLPPEARHIFFWSFDKSAGYVFDISEADFSAWAKSRGFLDNDPTSYTSGHVRFRFDDLLIEEDIADGIIVQNRTAALGTYSLSYDCTRHRAYLLTLPL